MAKHAILSPSGAHRWMSCVGAPAMELNEPDSGSDYADEGTAAHFLAAECLRNNTDPAHYIKRVIEVGCHPESDFDGAVWGGEATDPSWKVRNTYVVDEDLLYYVRVYVNNIRQYAQGGTLFVEQELPIGHLTGEANATGTGDAVVLLDVDSELQLHDLKYGYRPVSPEKNKQLMLYALGAIESTRLLGYEFRTVRVVIHQPRASEHPQEWDCTIEELQLFSDEVKERARLAQIALQYRENWYGKDLSYLSPSEEACEWCRAKATCPKLAEFVQQTVAVEFETLVDEDQAEAAQAAREGRDHVQAPLGTEYPPAELSVKMRACNLIEVWIKAVRARVESNLLGGVAVPGYKLVQGKKGNRQWKSEEEAEQLLKSFRLKSEEMYDFSLISPTTAEKVLKESPKRWAKAQAMIVQKDGKISVAPADDKRPEWKPTPPQFENLATGEDLL